MEFLDERIIILSHGNRIHYFWTQIEGGRAGCRGGAPPMEVASLFYTKISHIRVSEIHILYGN